MKTPRIVAAAVAGLLLAGTLGTPADANVRKFHDKRGDAKGSVDITKVRVDNSNRKRNKVIVRVKQRRLRSLDGVHIYFDTKPRRRGPEFRLSGYYGSEYYMKRMKGWRKAGRMVKCRGYSLKMKPRGVTRAVVNRRCLGKPAKVRVAVRAQNGKRRDWARAKYRWLGWVKR